MRLEVTLQALQDLKDTARHIAKDKRGAASAWTERIWVEFLVIQRSPLIFPAIPELHFGLRKARHGDYLILYRTQGDVVRIERVIHGMRDLPRHIL